MGVAGVEGVFRRCCEKTLEVLQLNQVACLPVPYLTLNNTELFADDH